MKPTISEGRRAKKLSTILYAASQNLSKLELIVETCVATCAGRGIYQLADTPPGSRSMVVLVRRLSFWFSVNERLRFFLWRLRPLPARWWLLFPLQLLLLLFVSLLQLLRLLLVPLFYLLLSRFIGISLRQPLEFLLLLFLLRELLFLLLLVLLVQLRLACTWRTGSRRRRKVARMDRGRVGSRSIVLRPVLRTRSRRVAPRLLPPTIGGGGIGTTCRFGRYDGAVLKYSWLRCRCDCRLAHVHRSPLLRVGSGRLRVLNLNRDRRNMSLMRRSLLLRCRTRVDSAVAAVEADARLRVVDHRLVVNVVNDRDVHVVHRLVVEEAIVVPTSAFVTFTKIAEAIVDPAIETDYRTPI